MIGQVRFASRLNPKAAKIDQGNQKNLRRPQRTPAGTPWSTAGRPASCHSRPPSGAWSPATPASSPWSGLGAPPCSRSRRGRSGRWAGAGRRASRAPASVDIVLGCIVVSGPCLRVCCAGGSKLKNISSLKVSITSTYTRFLVSSVRLCEGGNKDTTTWMVTQKGVRGSL